MLKKHIKRQIFAVEPSYLPTTYQNVSATKNYQDVKMAKHVLVTTIIAFISLYLTTSNGLKYQRCIHANCKDWSDKLKNPANTAVATTTISERKIYSDKGRPYLSFTVPGKPAVNKSQIKSWKNRRYISFTVLAIPVINKKPGKIDKNRPRFAFKKTPLNKSDKSESQRNIQQNRPRLALTDIFPDKQNQNNSSVKMLKKISNQHFLNTTESCDIELTETGKFLFDILHYSCNEIQKMQIIALLANKKQLQSHPVRNNEGEYDLKGGNREFSCTQDYCYRIQENGKKIFYTCNYLYCAPVKKEHIRHIKIAKMDIAKLAHHPIIHSPQAIKQPE